MILVVGGTGRLGASLLPDLTAAGERVRVLTRNRDAALPDGCERAVGDLRDPGSIALAVAGCDTVIAAAHGIEGGHRAGPEAVDARGNIALIDAAVAAGVHRFVMVSTQGASTTSALPLMRSKALAEQHLAATDLDWLVVRPALYLETWLQLVVGAKVPEGKPAMVLGNGTNPITFVSVADTAAVIIRALADGTSRTTIDVTGPASYTLHDLAKATGAARVSTVPRPALAFIRYAARPFAPAFARKAAMDFELDTAPQTTALGQGTPTPTRTLYDVAGTAALNAPAPQG